MTRRVVFTPEAADQLTELYGFIAEANSPEAAARYTDAIVTYCESLVQFPNRGLPEMTSGGASARRAKRSAPSSRTRCSTT